MKTRPTDFYQGHDPRDLPAYTIGEAAHYLRVPTPTLRSWVVGRSYPVKGGDRFFKPVIPLPDTTKHQLSFINLVEAHLLDAIRSRYNVPLLRSGKQFHSYKGTSLQNIPSQTKEWKRMASISSFESSVN